MTQRRKDHHQRNEELKSQKVPENIFKSNKQSKLSEESQQNQIFLETTNHG